MKEIVIKQYVKMMFAISVLVFVLNKLIVRDWLEVNDTPGILESVSYSIPNFLEAIVGTLITTGILLQIRLRFYQRLKFVSEQQIYILSTFLAGAYVISQELGFHNLGGNNTYDPNDLLASAVGLIVTLVVLLLYGFTDAQSKSIGGIDQR